MNHCLDGNDIDVSVVVDRVLVSPDCAYSLYDMWRCLTDGVLRVVLSHCDENTCYLVVRHSEVCARINPQQLRILENVLHGYCPKRLAIDLGLACSTITASAKLALAKIGVDCLPSRVPLPVVVVARASDARARPLLGNSYSFTHRGDLHQIIAVGRPDLHLSNYLPPAEVEVMRARLEGLSHQRIARVRRTSERTVANQLASASRRLGVSGRLDIIGHLARQSLPVSASN